MTGQTMTDRPRWADRLDIVGSEIFLRYRKRLLTPGIAGEIRRDYPGLSLVDVLVRVHAARRIVEQGDDFAALMAIRRGEWRPTPSAHAVGGRQADARYDRLSRALVRIGKGMFVLFCAGGLGAAMSNGAASVNASVVPLILVLVFLLLGSLGGRRRAGR